MKQYKFLSIFFAGIMTLALTACDEEKQASTVAAMQSSMLRTSSFKASAKMADATPGKQTPDLRPTTDIVSVLNVGLFSYEDTATSQLDKKDYPIRNAMQIKDGKLGFIVSKAVKGSGWVVAANGEFDGVTGEYIMKPDGTWSDMVSQTLQNSADPIVSTDSSTIVTQDPYSTVSTKYTFQQTDVTGVIYGYAFNAVGYTATRPFYAVNADSTFQTNSLLYKITAVRDKDLAIIYNHLNCDYPNRMESIPNCNYVPALFDAKTTGDLIGRDLWANGMKFVLASDGTGKFLDYQDKYYFSFTWTKSAKTEMLVFNIDPTIVPKRKFPFNDLVEDGGQVGVAIHHGLVKWVNIYPAGLVQSGVKMNTEAWNSLMWPSGV